MSSSDDKPQPARPSAGKPAADGKATGESGASREEQMGAALRSVYQRAIDEKVPDDLMDLLGKLG